MLVLDGDERLTAELALDHPYFDSLRDPDDFPEPTPYDDSHDNATLSLDEWKRKLSLPLIYNNGKSMGINGCVKAINVVCAINN